MSFTDAGDRILFPNLISISQIQKKLQILDREKQKNSRFI